MEAVALADVPVGDSVEARGVDVVDLWVPFLGDVLLFGFFLERVGLVGFEAELEVGSFHVAHLF